MRYMSADALITISRDIRGGKACIAGTRITVYDILEYMAGGMSESEILRNSPPSNPSTSEQSWRSQRRGSGD